MASGCIGVTGLRPRHGQPLELISVERLHRQEVQRHGALASRLGPRTVDVVAAQHVQVSPLGLAPQQPRIQQQVDVAAAQPAQFSAAQPRPGHQQHSQPVPR
jgi:hypothetical protein